MKKAGYKTPENKIWWIQRKVRLKDIICVSDDFVRWAKRYMNRSQRRKEKQHTNNFNNYIDM